MMTLLLYSPFAQTSRSEQSLPSDFSGAAGSYDRKFDASLHDRLLATHVSLS